VDETYRRTHPDRVSKDYCGLMATPYQEWLVGDAKLKLVLLMLSSALLLLIACLNLASLMLARLAARQKEIAVRLALGSSRARLLQQFVIEGVVLCGAGGLAGLAGVFWLLKGFVAAIPFPLPAAGGVELDLPVLAFTAAISFGTVLLISVAPAWMSSRLVIHDTLKHSGRASGGAGDRLRVRNVLVVAEVAVAATLLIAAALLIHSLYRLNKQELGFAPKGLLTFWMPPQSGRAPDVQRLRNIERSLLAELRAMPGVRSVAAVNVLPLGGQSNFPAQRENHPEQSIGGMEIRVITPGYFQTMGTPLRLGRQIEDRDAGGAPPVIIINEALARRWCRTEILWAIALWRVSSAGR
jgi:putative ABC transport system permease protein